MRGASSSQCARHCIVRRASLPLTPAAEFFRDLIRQASVQLGKPAPVATKNASQVRKTVGKASKTGKSHAQKG